MQKAKAPDIVWGFHGKSREFGYKCTPPCFWVHFRSGGCNFKNPLQPNSLHYGIIYTRIHIRFVLVKPLCGIFRLIG